MIEFKNVYKKYDSGTEALKNINLRIERGEFVFIVGASGSGKSTFLKTIMREEVPTSGTIMINNYDLTRMTDKEIPYFRRTMGIVFQDFRLIQTMNVYDNVAFAMRVIGANEKEIKKRVPYVLSLVGLQSKARSMPNEISGGEQQRVALARALVNNANTIIADEPTGNIDPEMSYEIVDLLNRINENGTTVIMVTHEHELVKKFNHRIVVIDHGSVISDTGRGGQLTYDETTGYKTLRPEAEDVPEVTIDEFIEEAIAEEAAFEEPAAPEPAAVAEPVAAPIPEPVAAPAPEPVAEPASDVSPVAGPDQTMYIEQIAALEAAAKIREAMAEPQMGGPLQAASDALSPEEQINVFASIDGVDYSKYFENSEDEEDDD